MYYLLYEKKVLKQLDSIPDTDLEKIKEAVKALALNPMPFGYKKISGRDGLYRIRQGDYRIIYSIDTKEYQVKIFLIKHRKESYRNL